MAPPKSTVSLLPVAVSVGAAVLTTAWLYRQINLDTKPSDNHQERRADVSEPKPQTDVLLQREIGISNTQGQDGILPNDTDDIAPRILSPGTVTIAYCSTTGTCSGFANRLRQELIERLEVASAKFASPARRVQLIQVSEVDWWDELVNNEDELESDGNANRKVGGPILLFVLPTWTDGTLPPDSQVLLQSLEEISTDWRVAPEPLRSSNPQTQLKVGAFGMGSSAYDAVTVGKPAKDVFSCLVGKLGARPLVGAKPVSNKKNVESGRKSKSLMIGDSEVGDSDVVFEKWMSGIVSSIFTELYTPTVSSNPKSKPSVKKQEQLQTQCDNKGSEGKESGCACKSETADSSNTGCCSSNHESDTKNGDGSSTDSLSEDEDDDDDDDDAIVDLEDMGNVMKSQSSAMKSSVPKEMVTPKQAKALKKEGYKLIGTHSAVKLCRWTKHQLRGRGGCYKHTHYGITSYQCMEATPSLACANKCVFCWRHHKNPVGREWRWKTDDPTMIVEEAVNMHVDMIKETRGIPGIQMDRWAEAHKVRHCALSLVGEPIMYPRINELLYELHEREISTFLVTNGQHPQAINDLVPITQLYVSVDASTPESLEAIDRPLFRDAWDRLKQSLSCLKRKGQRTVARLTVVKGWNSEEIGGYARLIALGHCSLVEVKGVTFCGKSDASNLNMTNTPWHHEVVEFTKILRDELNAIREEGGDDPLPEYDLACEHKHSCSVLLARVDQFAVPDPDDPSKRKWRTWIDYDKFQMLAKKHKVDPAFTFGVKDYIADTPSWAVFGADEEGFDPTDNRHRRKKKYPKYARFDEKGVPTHDTFDQSLDSDEIARLRSLMEQKKVEVGEATTVTEFKSGEKRIEDASLMFRGLVVIR